MDDRGPRFRSVLKKFLHFHYPGILWIGVILVLTSLPGRMIPKVPVFLDLFQPDKLVHLFLFAVLLFFLLNGFRKQGQTQVSYRFSVRVSLFIGILLGAITESLQATPLVTGRQCSVYDFIADVAGCYVGWGIFVLWKKRNTM